LRTTDWTYIRDCVVGTIMYFLLASVFVYSAGHYFDDVDTNSSDYQAFYYRGSVNTTWFAPGGLLLYVSLHALGYTLISLVNCQRSDPLMSGNKNHRAFWMTLFFATIFYFVSGAVTMRQQHDLSGYCQPSNSEDFDLNSQQRQNRNLLRSINLQSQSAVLTTHSKE